ncbi:hypothetical protein BKA93DRAFT_99521 [Sparassis latifolia]
MTSSSFDTNTPCASIQIHPVPRYKYTLCLDTNTPCASIQIHPVPRYKYTLCLVCDIQMHCTRDIHTRQLVARRRSPYDLSCCHTSGNGERTGFRCRGFALLHNPLRQHPFATIRATYHFHSQSVWG